MARGTGYPMAGGRALYHCGAGRYNPGTQGPGYPMVEGEHYHCGAYDLHIDDRQGISICWMPKSIT